MLPRVDIYPDGSCYPNPGPGGWAAVLRFKKPSGEWVERDVSGPCPKKTTNNRMEIRAAIEALRVLKRPCRVAIYTDSAYLRNAMHNGWPYGWKRRGWKKSAKGRVKNQELWEELLDVCEPHRIDWHHMRGHGKDPDHPGNPFNERADHLAGERREEAAARMGL